MRGATYCVNMSPSLLYRSFQPTRPLRGATAEAIRTFPFHCISTHAPLAGRDFSSGLEREQRRISTHAPLAGRDKGQHGLTMSDCISTHAPLAGRDRKGKPPFRIVPISTHAPLAGRDKQKSTNHYAHFCDNRQISDAFAQNAACQGILLLFDAGKPCGFWVRTAQVISAHLCFAL